MRMLPAWVYHRLQRDAKESCGQERDCEARTLRRPRDKLRCSSRNQAGEMPAAISPYSIAMEFKFQPFLFFVNGNGAELRTGDARRDPIRGSGRVRAGYPAKSAL